MTQEEVTLFLILTIICVGICALIAVISYYYHYKDDIKDFIDRLKNHNKKEKSE